MKLPEQAKRVFKGIIFDVYQWQQKMFDGSEATFEALKRPSTVLVLATNGPSIYICEEEQPGRPVTLSLFGGRQEEGEEPLTCAKRELLEEAGLTSDDWEEHRVYQPMIKMDWAIHLFIARDCKKVAEQALDAGERITIKKMHFDEFMALVKTDQFTDTELALEILRFDDLEREAFKKKLGL